MKFFVFSAMVLACLSMFVVNVPEVSALENCDNLRLQCTSKKSIEACDQEYVQCLGNNFKENTQTEISWPSEGECASRQTECLSFNGATCLAKLNSACVLDVNRYCDFQLDACVSIELKQQYKVSVSDLWPPTGSCNERTSLCVKSGVSNCNSQDALSKLKCKTFVSQLCVGEQKKCLTIKPTAEDCSANYGSCRDVALSQCGGLLSNCSGDIESCYDSYNKCETEKSVKVALSECETKKQECDAKQIGGGECPDGTKVDVGEEKDEKKLLKKVCTQCGTGTVKLKSKETSCSTSINLGAIKAFPNPVSASAADPQTFIATLIKALLGIIGSLALGLVVYGGIVWMTSAGVAARIESGRKTVIWAALGLATVFVSSVLVKFLLDSVG